MAQPKKRGKKKFFFLQLKNKLKKKKQILKRYEPQTQKDGIKKTQEPA